jgi:hypothetical protein
MLRLFILLTVACMVSLPAYAQGASASISGIVSDATGAVLPGVTVTALNTDTMLKQTTVSSSSGLYSLAPLPPGNYSITAAQQGFSLYTVLRTLAVGEAASLNIALKVGAAEQSVTVNEGQVLINTTNSEISNVIGQKEITQLPLNGRDPASLIFLSPGVQNVLNLSGVGTLPTSNTFLTEVGGSGNGLQQGSTFAMLDGIPNMDTYDGLMQPFPNPDATHAFQAVTDTVLKPGETVLINGATGTAGRLAVQIAKHLGAGKVIATGRNEQELEELKSIGADVVVPFDLGLLHPTGGKHYEEALKTAIADGVNVVLDYLWGKSVRTVMAAIARTIEDATPVRFVHIGGASGEDSIDLPGTALRSSSIQLMGSGLKSVPIEKLLGAIANVFAITKAANLQIATRTLSLSSIEEAWDAPSKPRVVVKI